jgi:alpha-1,6-mannosyltransferase
VGYPVTAGRLIVPPWSRTAAAGLGMAMLVAGAALIELDAAAGGSHQVDDGHSIPPSVLGPLAGHGGSYLFISRFWLLLAVMAAGYALVVVAAALRPAYAIAGIAVLHLIVILGPPLTSDVFSYLDYARLGVLHGINPYAHSPAFLKADPAYAYVGHLWRHVASAYGPLFTVASYPAALLGVAGGVMYLKSLAVLSSLAVAGLTAACAHVRGRDPVRAALIVGANPLMIVYGAAAAHNDLMMIALVMLGVWLALRGRAAGAGGASVLAAAVKASAVVVLPFMLIGSRERLRTAAGALAAAVAVGVMAAAVFGGKTLGFIPVLERQQRLSTPNAFPSEVARLFGQSHLTAFDRTLLHVALAGALVYLLVRVWRGADWLTGAGWALLATAVATTWMLSWYTLWALPFAALTRDRRLLAAVLLIQGLYLAHRLGPLVPTL